jgi:hypothetical protein
MHPQASEVITNFNTFLREQQSVEGKAKLTLALFDDKYEVVHNKVDIMDVKPLTAETYFVRGMTAMNDAIGKTLSNMQKKKNAIVLVHTDGHENASKEFDAATVKTLVDELKKKWEFIFVGGEIDAQQIGSKLGFDLSKSLRVSNDTAGNANVYAAFAATTMAYRSGGKVASDAIDLEDVVAGIKS